MTTEQKQNLLSDLLKEKQELSWLEFKHNRLEPKKLGEYIAGLSNAACLEDRKCAYLVFGIKDETLQPIGTNFKPLQEKINGGQPLVMWLNQNLKPALDLKFYEYTPEIEEVSAPIVVIEIPKAQNSPSTFNGTIPLRLENNLVQLQVTNNVHVTYLRMLWQKTAHYTFESDIALQHLAPDQINQLLDYSSYQQRLDIKLPFGSQTSLDRMEQDGLIVQEQGNFSITNLGALLFARRLSDFPHLARKAPRVVIYHSISRMETAKELNLEGRKGYLVGFDDLLQYIVEHIPQREVLKGGSNVSEYAYPIRAIRELLANMLIHQDFSENGNHPMIEIFPNRIEFKTPGRSLLDEKYFINQDVTRNKILANFLLKLKEKIFEERGQGIDAVIEAVEHYHLPPPKFELKMHQTICTIYTYKPIQEYLYEEKLWACYHHACLRYVQGLEMTNQSLRERLQIEEKNMAIVSRLMKDALKLNLIKKIADRSNKFSAYIPSWGTSIKLT